MLFPGSGPFSFLLFSLPEWKKCSKISCFLLIARYAGAWRLAGDDGGYMSQKQERLIPTRELLRRFVPYFKRYRGMLLLDLFCASLTTVCEIVFPLIVRTVTNRAMSDPASITVRWVAGLGLLYLLLRVIDAAGAYWMQSRGHFMGARIERDMRSDLFEHLQKLSFTFYNNNKTTRMRVSAAGLTGNGQPVFCK